MGRGSVINMKHLTLLLLMLLTFTSIHAQNEGIESDMFASMKGSDKAAVVAVHFGTTNEDARIQSIERFNMRLREAFKQYEFREAWTSRIVIKKMQEHDIVKQTPSQLLEELRQEGFTHILLQPSNIINGTEMDYLRLEVDKFRNMKAFKDIRIGDPLLSSVDDYYKAVEAECAIYKDKKTTNVLVCHGSAKDKNTQYTMLDYVFRDSNHDNWAVATIEGFPTQAILIKHLKANGVKKVNLIPFMFVAGDHVQKDIAEDWKKALESVGIKVAKVFTKGIGEYDSILDIYVKHAIQASKHRPYSSVEKKMISSH